MSLYGFAAFCAVYLLAVATPGPGVAAVLSRSLTHGMRGAPAFIAGFLITFILPLVLGGYALAASRARRFFRKPSSIRLLNRGAGTAMAGAAIVVAAQ
jgi:threonine/homoserine/homoserine lactone efflux protein